MPSLTISWRAWLCTMGRWPWALNPPQPPPLPALGKGLGLSPGTSCLWLEERKQGLLRHCGRRGLGVSSIPPGPHVSKLRVNGRNQWVGRKWSKLGVTNSSSVSMGCFSVLKTKACRPGEKHTCGAYVFPKNLATIYLNKTMFLWLPKKDVCWLPAIVQFQAHSTLSSVCCCVPGPVALSLLCQRIPVNYGQQERKSREAEAASILVCLLFWPASLG